MADLRTKLEVFSEFLDCAGISFWHFDGEMRLIFSNTPNQEQMQMIFNIGGCKKMIHQYCMENRLPGFCSDTASLIWLASPQYVNEVLTDIYIIGPVFSSSTSEQTLTTALRDIHASPELIRATSGMIKAVPVIPHTFLMQYGLMLYRCLTGTKLETADIQVISSASIQKRIPTEQSSFDSRIGTYAFEKIIFQAVEDGNIDFVHPSFAYQRHTGVLCRTNPLRNAKNEIITCITLLTRAAIRGGMPEDSAYCLADYYIQLVEDTNSVADVYQYSQDAFKDYTSRVHKCKLNSGRSKEIQDCISYLELNLSRKVTMKELSANLGYNKNYLSTKFAREVGMTISEYLLQLRIERSKVLLQNTAKSVQEIADELSFNSVSYFSAQFKRVTGQSPSDFRNRTEH